MKTRLFISILMIILLYTTGCNMMCREFGLFCDKPIEVPVLDIQGDIKETKEIIRDNATTIEEASENIKREAEIINEETDKTKEKIPERIKPDINPHLDLIQDSSIEIVKNTEIINKATGNLEEADIILSKTIKKVKTTDEIMSKLKEERDKAIKAKDDQMQKMLRWVIVGSIIGAGGLGVFGFMYGSKFSLTLSLVCMVVMSIAIFVSTYLVYIIIFGGIVLIALVGLLVYNIIIQKKAFSEVVETVEIAQDNMSVESKNKIFGGDGEAGVMKKIQNKTTMELIKKEKNKMSNLWKYAKNGRE